MDNCSNCGTKLKFFRYNAKPNWEIRGQLCKKCFGLYNSPQTMILENNLEKTGRLIGNKGFYIGGGILLFVILSILLR